MNTPTEKLRRRATEKTEKAQAAAQAEAKAAEDAQREPLKGPMRDEAIALRERQLALENQKAAEEFKRMAGSGRRTSSEAAIGRKIMAQARAEQQALEDALRLPGDIDVTLTPGAPVPLHVQNMRQRLRDRMARDDARDATKAAAQAIHQSLLGTAEKRRKGRFAKKANFETQVGKLDT